jgi:nucleoid DNA-binding protein
MFRFVRNLVIEGDPMAENNTKARAATKTAMFQALAESTGLSRKQVAGFFDEFANYLRHELGKKGPGIVTLPGLLKIKRVNKPATKPRQGRNPKTGEPMMIAAKPARTVVKALALKGLKEMVGKGGPGK